MSLLLLRKRFNPRNLPNLQLWLDATRIAQADSTSVATWSDQSGNGYDATQGGSAARPTFIASGLNGLPVVRFDGTDDQMTLGASALGMLRNVAGATVFAVVKYSNVGGTRAVVNISGGTGVSRLLLYTAGEFRILGRRLDGDTAESAVSSNVALNSRFYIQSGIANYGDSKLFQYIDGILNGTDDPFLTAGNTSNTDSTNIAIGNFGVQFLNGDIAEIIVYNRALNTSELAQVHRYLARKWGIALA